LARSGLGVDCPLRGEDAAFVHALMERHPHWTFIEPCGVKYFFVQQVPTNPQQRRFVLVKKDDSWWDGGWRNALTPRSARQQVQHTLRHYIRPQILAFRDANFNGVCATCPALIADCEVDHTWPVTFEVLVDSWLHSVRLTPEEITIIPSTQYEVASVLEDDLLAESWLEYHEINARLRCLCKKCHQSTPRMKVAV